MAFYVKYGFIQFPAGTQTLFLPVETIAVGLGLSSKMDCIKPAVVGGLLLGR
jgi:hypothetical protein